MKLQFEVHYDDNFQYTYKSLNELNEDVHVNKDGWNVENKISVLIDEIILIFWVDTDIYQKTEYYLKGIFHDHIRHIIKIHNRKKNLEELIYKLKNKNIC